MVSVRAYAILIILGVCDSFNFDLNFVDLISVGSGEKYFGYSLLLQKGDVSRVIVGAPNSNSSYAVHNSIGVPGALYKCDIGTSSSCQQYVIESKGNTEVKSGDNRYNFKDLKDNGLMGAAVEGGDNVDDPLYVCSPRWKNDRSDRYGQHYLANGICYGMTTSSNITADWERYMPLLNAGKQGYTLAKVVKYYYAMGQLGFAMHYVTRQRRLLLGAPGVLGWRGSIVQVAFQDTSNLQIQRRDTHQRHKRQLLYSFNVPNPVYISSLEEDNFYFGYSVSSGRFVRKYSDLWFIAGSPRAADLYGMVLLFEFPQYEDSDLIVHKKFIGEQFGSYFGGSVLGIATSDLGAQMGIFDLLVGAPTYTTDTWDEGCVYFYKNKGEGNLDSPRKIYGSKKPGARFGTAMSAIGDVNKDSFEGQFCILFHL
ncbi:integrin alpha-PS4-like [Photinus pyralis]|uniref:integrin alpha-PS4-like n=1 Tax=Photinus pyralis TaxID=7054 RepID=UPI0012670EFF|nr:integrin alpha-PS4-like [Photinus pyralis]